MSVKTHQCFTVACDVCGENVTSAFDDGIIVHFDSEADGLSSAEDGDWHTGQNGEAICDNGDVKHLAAIRALHAAGMDENHWCWLVEDDEDDVTAPTTNDNRS